MSELWVFVCIVARSVWSRAWSLFGFATLIVGGTAVGALKTASRLDSSSLLVLGVAFLLAFVSIGSFDAWRTERAQRLSDHASADSSTQPVLIGGTGGAGGSGAGSTGGVVYAGHGGGGGGVAYGEGSHADGGTGGAPAGPSTFESLARASIGMGYPLEEFIELAGFDPSRTELDEVGRGGGGGGDSDGGSSGGPGLVIIQAKDQAGSTIQVDVFKANGSQFTVRRRDS